MARRKYLFPFRTQKSSSSAAIILRKWETSTVPNYTITPGNTRGFVLSCHNETVNICEICPIITIRGRSRNSRAGRRILVSYFTARPTVSRNSIYCRKAARFVFARANRAWGKRIYHHSQPNYYDMGERVWRPGVNPSCLMNLAFTGCRGDSVSIEVRDGNIDSHPVAYGKSALRKKRPISQIGSFSFLADVCVTSKQVSCLFM